MNSKPSRKWYLVRVETTSAAAEAIEQALNELGTIGTEINLMPDGRRRAAETVVGYFDTQPLPARVSREIELALSACGLNPAAVTAIEYGEIAEQDWLSEWKKHWRPVRIGKFIIAPPWEKVGDSSAVVLRIEPAMAFGTGTHATTQLCLAAISEAFRSGESMLDVGTGTGILAIAAAKINKLNGSAAKVFACDTDADAVAIAGENAALNGVADAIQFTVGGVETAAEPCDFVCANLTLDVIISLLDALLAKTRRQLVLSGILLEQEAAIRSALAQKGADVNTIERSGEWIAVSIAV